MASSFAAQRLPDRAVVRLTGEAPLAFLNNLLTCDLSATPPGQWAYGALLSAQGKIQHDVFLLAEGNSIFVDCAASQAQGLVQKLRLYRLRAKIEITLDETLAIAVGSAEGLGAKDPRAAALGRRSIVNHGVLDGGSGYHAARIALGLADSSMDIGENRLFPHEANLDLLGGVSFSKGCYIGQEVVSRMQHRGTARSRILGVSSSTALPAPGSAITSGETHVGEMLSSVETRGLALIRLDRLAEAREPLLTSSVRLTVHKPGWMTVPFTIPDQSA